MAFSGGARREGDVFDQRKSEPRAMMKTLRNDYVILAALKFGAWGESKL
jgi:hypothetical protein